LAYPSEFLQRVDSGNPYLLVRMLEYHTGKPSRWAYVPNYGGRPIHHIQDPWEESTVLHRKTQGTQLSRALSIIYDLGASVNLMSKAMFE
jgi:hypothetical protein